MQDIDYSEVISRIQPIYESSTEEEKHYLRTILEEISTFGESETYKNIWLADYKEIPVDKETFLTSPEYLGASNDCGATIYPRWMEVMKELEAAGNQYYEIVFTGATRTGKTSTAVSDAAYQLYRIMCLKDPQRYFNLKSVTNIVFFFFNITQTLAKGVAFKEFNTTLSVSPWFLKHGSMNKSEATPTYIPEGGTISIEYGSEASHALGAAAFCVVFDECNFAKAGIKDVAKAKEAMKAKYDTLVARVTGTYVKNGEVYGKLYIISSKKNDSDFMEDYVATQREAGNPHMYIFDEPQWKVWPASKYSSDKMFKVALGGKHLRSFVVPDNQMDEQSLEDIRKQGYQLMDVPEDNKVRFLSDIEIALRDIAGVTVPGMLSFITQDLIDACIGERRNPFWTDIITTGNHDNLTIEEFFHLECVDDRLRACPMYIHLDLSLVKDRSGVSGVAVSGRRDIAIGDKVVSVPTLSHIFTVGIEAPRGDKISFQKIFAFILWLRMKGFHIECVSRDQFQSDYIGELLEAQGFKSPKISLDRTPDGCIAGRSVISEQRIDMVHVELLEHEMIHLQRDAMTGKVDHPVGGSKDLSDSFMGAIWQAIQSSPSAPVAAKKVSGAIAAVNGPKRNSYQTLPSMFPGIRKR